MEYMAKKSIFSVNDGNSVQYATVRLLVAQQWRKVLKSTAWMIPLWASQAPLLWLWGPR